MPYVKRGGQKVWRNSRTSKTMNGRKLTPKQKKQVKTLIKNRQELKYLQYSDANRSVSTTAFITGSNFDVAQGSTDQERDGDRFQWCGTMDFRISLVAGDTYNLLRCIIFQWHPDYVPVVTDLLIVGPSGNQDVWSQYNHDKRQQYTILFDKTYKLVGNGTAGTFPGTDSSVQYRRHLISFKRAQKNAQRIGGSLVGTNRCYMCFVSDSAAPVHPVINWSSKVFYRDS